MSNRNTNQRACGFSEEELIDVVLGKSSEERTQSFHLHLNECRNCRHLYVLWSGILSVGTVQETTIPARLRIRLKWEMIKRKWWTIPKWKTMASVVTAMMITVMVVGLFQLRHVEEANDWTTATQFNEHLNHAQVSISEKPHSMQYPIYTSAEHSHLRGTVWYNGHSQEVLILLDGVDPSEKKDYQAWSIKGKHRANIGLFTLYEQKGYFYFQGEEMLWIEQLAVSLEPKGGSLVPTGPDAILVNLQR